MDRRPPRSSTFAVDSISSLILVLRVAASGPWHVKHRSEKMGRMSRLNSMVGDIPLREFTALSRTQRRTALLQPNPDIAAGEQRTSAPLELHACLKHGITPTLPQRKAPTCCMSSQGVGSPDSLRGLATLTKRRGSWSAVVRPFSALPRSGTLF